MGGNGRKGKDVRVGTQFHKKEQKRKEKTKMRKGFSSNNINISEMNKLFSHPNFK